MTNNMLELADAIERIREWERQRATLRGLDPYIVHQANFAPLLLTDLRIILREVEAL